MHGLELDAEREPWGKRINFLLIGRIFDGVATQMTVAEPVTMRPGPDDLNAPYPSTFSLDFDAAQKLMDQLWDCGLRPSEGSGSAGTLAATQKHLEDMRRMAFHNLNVPIDSEIRGKSG